MVAKTFLLDWRNLSKWTKADRERPHDMASVSGNHDRDPFGLMAGRRLVAQAPAIYMTDGAPRGALSIEAHDRGYDRIEGKLQETWRSGRNSLVALNMARVEVATWFGKWMVEHYPWAAGHHWDYATTLQWLLTLRYPDTYWEAWKKGIMFGIAAAHKKRPDWIILAQQFSMRSYLDGQAHLQGANGLFREQHLTRFGVPIAQHKAEILAHGATCRAQGIEQVEVVELIEPWLSNAAYRDVHEQFCEETGTYLSRGRQ